MTDDHDCELCSPAIRLAVPALLAPLGYPAPRELGRAVAGLVRQQGRPQTDVGAFGHGHLDLAHSAHANTKTKLVIRKSNKTNKHKLIQ